MSILDYIINEARSMKKKMKVDDNARIVKPLAEIHVDTVPLNSPAPAEEIKEVKPVEITAPILPAEPAVQGTYTILWKKIEGTKKEVDALRGKGHGKTNAMNEEYYKLLSRLQDAMKAVKEFEDKLTDQYGKEDAQK